MASKLDKGHQSKGRALTAPVVIALTAVTVSGGETLDVRDRFDVPDDDAAHGTHLTGPLAKNEGPSRAARNSLDSKIGES